MWFGEQNGGWIQVFFLLRLVTLSRKVNQKRKKSSLHWFKRSRRAPNRGSLWRSHKQNCEGTGCLEVTGEHLTERNLTSSYRSDFRLSGLCPAHLPGRPPSTTPSHLYLLPTVRTSIHSLLQSLQKPFEPTRYKSLCCILGPQR